MSTSLAVLPAFSGNIPAALKLKFPSAKVTHLGNCDTFDENTPPLSDPNYISSLGAATFRGMQSGDEDAIWLMQGWLFTYDPFWEPPQMKALLHSVPVGRMIVLDLCMLHNFAADFEMYGVLDAVAAGPIDARLSDNSTMVGVGMSMEGIEQNPIVYDLMSEMSFHHRQVNIKDKNRDVIVAFPDVEPFVIQTTGLYTSTTEETSVISSKNINMKDASGAYEKPHL
ncbi:hypothetical protein PR202_gb14126 [Eleusine coracana subsp. coracana]|uniref:Alpha-N-acetylglucosaminidase tim-barrel domain-containing protein n=1 Tax=Eleusine coracana subsp. coracana TaxID=191504 RepID=A0AAV5EUV3_ELECO|nr:hypothetical protein PR202_gb14126 [Eleusine coracana subsp. coracana]